MKLSSRKRNRCSEVDVGRDRLSEMPDRVIVHILCCLPTFDAVRTVLLRRFGNLWTLVPTLKFDFEEFLNNYQGNNDCFRQFKIFIRNVLMLHKRLSIDTFHLSLCPREIFESKDVDDVKIWLRFALGREAKEIKFYTFICDVSFLPNFTSQSLVTLELRGFRIDPQQVTLGSLKKLSLDSVDICEEAFQQFISGCPSLQELRIVNPCEIKKLSFTAPNIDKLSLVHEYEYEYYVENKLLLLDIPNLKSLVLNVCSLPVIIDVSSVRDLHIEDFFSDRYFSDDDDDEYNTMLKMFLGKFKDVEVFRLSRDAAVQFLDAIPCLCLSQNRWKCVVLELDAFSEDYFLGIYQLMRSLKDLEELLIYSKYWKDEAGTVLVPEEFSSPCVMPKLKSVTFHVCAKPWDRWLQLVQFVLRSAACLDKLVIIPCSNYYRLTTAEELEFVERVSSFHWSSPNASVLFL
ncbi:F-box/FBD/LRR-repeat protein At4g26340-like [Silene latifolia]|uniref:F-box/FBD/LRR-repeat protein At4g26340-like n=1 Tax=Silene latifolia TaxID=37657 RepID=UPI003D77F558